MSKILDEPEAKVIHMGSDLAISPKPSKKEARAKFSLPQDLKLSSFELEHY